MKAKYNLRWIQRWNYCRPLLEDENRREKKQKEIESAPNCDSNQKKKEIVRIQRDSFKMIVFLDFIFFLFNRLLIERKINKTLEKKKHFSFEFYYSI